MQNKKDNTSKDTSMRLKQIAKIIFLMIAFRIVMDSDFWIILSMTIIAMFYLLPVYLAKNAKSILNKTVIGNFMAKVLGFAHEWYEQNIHNQEKAKEQSHSWPVQQKDFSENSSELWEIPAPPFDEDDEYDFDARWHINSDEDDR